MSTVLMMYSSHLASPGHVRRVLAMLPGHQVVAVESEEQAVDAAADAVVILGHRFLRQVLPRTRRLRWVQASGGGVDHLPWREVLARGATLTTAGFAGPVVAQHAVMLAFAINRRLEACIRLQQQGRWGDDVYGLLPPRLRTALVLGLGSIGRHVAAMLSAGGIEVWGVSRSTSDASKVDRHFTTSEWRDVVDEVDLLVICLPGSDETRNLVDAPLIERLKESATVVNVGRAETLDLAALVVRLRQDRLAGAALDVMPGRAPLASGSELWSVPGLIVTPYLGARYADRWRDLESFVETQVERWAGGGRLAGIVSASGG